MQRMVLLASYLSLASALGGCMTYRQDLDRGKAHYERNEYEAALALFRVLEVDLDSLTVPEQAQYAYLRGMTDYRLSGLAAAGTNVADPKKAFRDNARHWLGLAAALEKGTAGGLNEDEKKRLADTLLELNRDVYGGAETAADEKDPKDKDKDLKDKDKDKDLKEKK